MAHPAVSIILPVRNEIDHIDACLVSLTSQDYPGPVEIVVADGSSDDGTRERLEGWAERTGLVIVDNEHRVQSAGLNRAAEVAAGEILVRADGHTEYPADYVRRNVAALLGGDAVAVGGVMRAVGSSPFSRAVAAAMATPLAIGPGRFHHATEAGPTDTVYLGAFRKADFQRLGNYRHFPSGVAEDADLYHRWRRAGATIWLDPSIESSYRPRRTPGALWRQAFRWGAGKAEMLYANGELPHWRPLLPLGLVLALIAGIALGVGWSWLPLLGVIAAWAVVLAAAALSARHLGVVPVAAIMHLGYGLGLATGLLRGRRRSRPVVL